ncbi:PhzF family phenazine biosynthesis protein [Frigoribacterium sp. 2-23]|uniref:PhzF family phenazine biosynthesis protein n=1 Tax=Frigoribacterium sp. 2-23 TaxID=3415006 RepID=UPI003C6F076F
MPTPPHAHTGTRSRDFAQVDVFSAVPYLGNPVAVVLDADGLSDDDMAAFARWTNLSETTFVLPPTGDADYRLRIFTPGGELPFAGHPTLGSAHAWLEAGGTPRAAVGTSTSTHATIVQECLAGLVELRVADGGLAFQAPPTRRSGPVDESDLARVSAALGVERGDIVAHQWVDNGPGWLAVELGSAAAVTALEPHLTEVDDLMIGVLGAHPDGSGFAYEVRGFCPAIGVREDPVTGSLNAAIAQWLRREDRAPESYRNTQGRRVGRDGVISITTGSDGSTWVGGVSTTCIRGVVAI